MSALTPHLRVLNTLAQALYVQCGQACDRAKTELANENTNGIVTELTAGIVFNGLGDALRDAAKVLKSEEDELGGTVIYHSRNDPARVDEVLGGGASV